MGDLRNMTPEEQAYYLNMLGIDADQGVFNDPSYNMPNVNNVYSDPGTNSVYDPKTGRYLGQTQQIPNGLLTMPQPAPISTDPVVNNMFQRNNTTPVDMSQIDRLLQNLNRYR